MIFEGSEGNVSILIVALDLDTNSYIPLEEMHFKHEEINLENGEIQHLLTCYFEKPSKSPYFLGLSYETKNTNSTLNQVIFRYLDKIGKKEGIPGKFKIDLEKISKNKIHQIFKHKEVDLIYPCIVIDDSDLTKETLESSEILLSLHWQDPKSNNVKFLFKELVKEEENQVGLFSSLPPIPDFIPDLEKEIQTKQEGKKRPRSFPTEDSIVANSEENQEDSMRITRSQTLKKTKILQDSTPLQSNSKQVIISSSPSRYTDVSHTLRLSSSPEREVSTQNEKEVENDEEEQDFVSLKESQQTVNSTFRNPLQNNLSQAMNQEGSSQIENQTNFTQTVSQIDLSQAFKALQVKQAITFLSEKRCKRCTKDGVEECEIIVGFQDSARCKCERCKMDNVNVHQCGIDHDLIEENLPGRKEWKKQEEIRKRTEKARNLFIQTKEYKGLISQSRRYQKLKDEFKIFSPKLKATCEKFNRFLQEQRLCHLSQNDTVNQACHLELSELQKQFQNLELHFD